MYDFRFYFTPLTGVLFTFPSRYLSTIGHQMVFIIGGWSTQLPTGFHVSRGTQDTASVSVSFRLRAYHPLRMSFPEHSAIIQCSYLCGPTTPTLQHIVQRSRFYVQCSLLYLLFFFNLELRTRNFEHSVVGLVWALPPSLAATEGISLDFSSSGY